MPDVPCPREDEHTPVPSGYGARQLWVEQMARTHRQTRCAGCGRYAVWVPRPGAPDLPPVAYRLDHAGCGCCDGDGTACGCVYHAGALRPLPRLAQPNQTTQEEGTSQP